MPKIHTAYISSKGKVKVKVTTDTAPRLDDCTILYQGSDWAKAVEIGATAEVPGEKPSNRPGRKRANTSLLILAWVGVFIAWMAGASLVVLMFILGVGVIAVLSTLISSVGNQPNNNTLKRGEG
jgi:hypothetical protein